MNEVIKVDALGDQCPIPVVKAKRALDSAVPGTVVEVHVDNEIAVQNLTKLAKSQQCVCQSKKLEKKHFVVEIAAAEKAAGPNGRPGVEDSEPALSCCLDAGDHSIVVISSAVMGMGDDELGKVLMKGFIYGLSQLDALPEKILFYNGGVALTTEGSDSLEDLKAMEAQGVQVFSCGTCLDYYGLAEKLVVGEVTNMYQIVEAMAGATKIIRP